DILRHCRFLEEFPHIGLSSISGVGCLIGAIAGSLNRDGQPVARLKRSDSRERPISLTIRPGFHFAQAGLGPRARTDGASSVRSSCSPRATTALKAWTQTCRTGLTIITQLRLPLPG